MGGADARADTLGVVQASQRVPDIRVLNARGLREMREGDRAAALATFAQAAALFPDVAEVHNNHGIVLQGLERFEDAVAAFERAVALDPTRAETLAHLGNAYAVQAKTQAAIAAYQRALVLRPDFIEAHLAVYEVAQMQGDRDLALRHQAAALARTRLYTEPAPPQTERRRVLMLCAPGDWQANVPLEFVFNRATTTVHKYFLDGDTPPNAAELPPYDLIFNAVAQSEETEPALRAVERFAAGQAKPLLNDPKRVRECSRESVRQKLAGLDGVYVAPVLRLERAALGSGLQATLEREGFALPILVRPVTSQAGIDLVKIESYAELTPYLARVSASLFYVCPFIDYRLADGHYRKYRVMFVDGEAYACHLAISSSWMVHYYNAQMIEHAWKREEEAVFLADVRNVFGARYASMFAEIVRRIGLDYFGIDCTLLPDGRLFIFEVDPAMVVHMSDSIEIFPYKHAFVPRILGAFEELLERTAQPAAGARLP